MKRIAGLVPVISLAVGTLASVQLRADRAAADRAVIMPGRGEERAWWEMVTEVRRDSHNVGTTTYRVPSDVLFRVDSSVLDRNGSACLVDLAPKLKNAVAVVVAGATDSTGTREHNVALSMARAEAAKLVLIRAGVPASIIQTAAWADEHPVADEDGPDPEQARALNRRIEILVTIARRSR